jgi:3-oxoacyl-[acyl-carrier protein] reductase
MISLAGKAALITGGSSGIGAATVKLFAQAGADVVFNFRRDKKAARQIEQEAGKHGTRVEGMRADLLVTDNALKLVQFAVERLGRLDILVANSPVGSGADLPIEQMTEPQWDEMMVANLKSVYALAHFAVPVMIAQGSGRIIAVNSPAGRRGEAFQSHFAATQRAVIGFVKSLSSELARHQILVNCVAPGWVEKKTAQPRAESKTGRKGALGQIPLGRPATAEEVAGPILFLASDLASFMTGEVLNVNGGAVLCG